MAKPKEFLTKLLLMLNDKPMTNAEICKSANVRRETVWKNRSVAEKKGFIKKDQLGKYYLTESGRLQLGIFEKSLETTSFNIHTQIIPLTSDTTDRPTAKCNLIIEDAARIRELDEKTSDYERF